MNKSFYAFDLNTTTSCNLRCTYCMEHEWFEKNTATPKPVMDNIKEKMDYLLQSDKFLAKYGGIKLHFWGGEPTLHPDIIEDLVHYYDKDDRVCFFIYTNGYNINETKPILEEYKYKKGINNTAKIHLQVSYDGLASHDIARVNIQGKGSALKVKQTLYWCVENKIPFGTKAVIDFANLDKLYDNYIEFNEMDKYFNTFGTGLNYHPSLDYLTDYEFTEEELNKYVDTLKEQMKKMAKHEMEYYKKHNRFLFGWMNPSLALCSAGDGLTVINTDGDIFACHGALYKDNIDDFKISNVKRDNEVFVDELFKSAEIYRAAKMDVPDECKECVAHYCLKCNVKKYDNSKKETFDERWSDYNNQPHICAIYQFMGKFRIALMKKMESRN